MARPSPSCAHDDDRLRLPAASPSRSNSAEKKESTDPRLSQLCPPYVTPSSSSSLEHHRSDARIVENGSAASSGVSNSAKVGLVNRYAHDWLKCPIRVRGIEYVHDFRFFISEVIPALDS